MSDRKQSMPSPHNITCGTNNTTFWIWHIEGISNQHAEYDRPLGVEFGYDLVERYPANP